MCARDLPACDVFYFLITLDGIIPHHLLTRATTVAPLRARRLSKRNVSPHIGGFYSYKYKELQIQGISWLETEKQIGNNK